MEGLENNSTKEWTKEVLREQKCKRELVKIKQRFEKDCCGLNPLEFWSTNQEECDIKIRPECMSMNPHEPTYLLSSTEVKEMDEHFNELLESNFIRKSKIPFACPAFLVNKRVERERGKTIFCINYTCISMILLYHLIIPYHLD